MNTPDIMNTPGIMNAPDNYYQNEEGKSSDETEKFIYMPPEFHGSQDSLYCNGRSQYPSMTSISTMPFCQSEISPKSTNLSPINEDDINESDSASQRGILMEKNGSLYAFWR